MGDAGSTVLGYIFAALPLLVVVEAKQRVNIESMLLAGPLVVWPFLADGIFTIMRRLRRRENIFNAHRSHLYQRLVIAGISHRNVSCIYGLLAVVGAFFAWQIVNRAPGSMLTSAIVLPIAFGLLWYWVVRVEKRT
jgi:UDP-N-acetylmuramyl pentapeptide phosphotransferase/UDP-N-acetylglucosamine-1-phosphate transferase